MPLPSVGEIAPYIERGLISERPHPLHPDVRIYNYTHRCQYEQAWDHITRACRGLVMNVKTGQVLAHPPKKFFNYQEHLQKGWPIPDETPIITEKLDGSLGILVHVDGVPYIATRGSFESEQATWGTAWWRARTPRVAADNTITHLFEIIAPCSRVVVCYDYEGLVYLGSRETATGAHLDYREHFSGQGIRVAREIPPTDLETLAAMDTPNEEGFVCHYPIANERLKLKFGEYVRLHRILTGLNDIAIWEFLRDGKPLDEILERVPDEFFAWFNGVVDGLREKYNLIHARALKDFEDVQRQVDQVGVTTPTERKKQSALLIQQRDNPGVLFAMLAGKPYDHIIWKQLRPKGQSSFRTDPDA